MHIITSNQSNHVHRNSIEATTFKEIIIIPCHGLFIPMIIQLHHKHIRNGTDIQHVLQALHYLHFHCTAVVSISLEGPHTHSLTQSHSLTHCLSVICDWPSVASPSPAASCSAPSRSSSCATPCRSGARTPLSSRRVIDLTTAV